MNFTKEPKKALEAINHAKSLAKSSSMNAAIHDQLIVMYVQICTSAGEKIQDASEETLEIDTSTDEGATQAIRALAFLLQYAAVRNETDWTRDNPEFLDLHVRVAQRIYDLAPEDVDNLFNLGAVRCLSGNSLEGCKCYRRALASGKGDDPFKRKYHEDNLILAQLQCPGIPFYSYIIVTTADRSVSCIKESDQEHCKTAAYRLGFGKGSGSLHVSNGKEKKISSHSLYRRAR